MRKGFFIIFWCVVMMLITIDGCKNRENDLAKKTAWFHDAGFGLFVHFLEDLQNNPEKPNSFGKKTSWNECVNGFDTDLFAQQVAETGAGYVIFTMMQRTRFLIAPNKTYDAVTGYKPGEACSTRDLVLDLYKSLNKYGVKLMLYWTGDGPRQDDRAAKAMGYTEKVSTDYVTRWAEVGAEYSRRYGNKVSGWWVDGCYEHIGYNEQKWTILANALREGNPDCIIALNNPKMTSSNSSTKNDDYTTGEQNEFKEIPDSRWRDGVQYHVLSYLGNHWADPGVRYSRDYMINYVRAVNAHAGVVSIDVAVYRDGKISPDQLSVLKGFRKELKND